MTNTPPTLRLAIIGSPRSGNSWVRMVLSKLYGLDEIPVHHPDRIDWNQLPRRCVIQIHWHPRPEFVEALDRHEVRVVVMARHPFDVLMSYLNLAYYSHLDGRCHGAGICKECVLVGALPTSDAFFQFATSDEGQLLVSHGPAWWNRPGVIRARYEDLVADPEGEFNRLAGEIGESPRAPVASAVESTSIRHLMPVQGAWHFHLWQGQPGLWRSMLPPDRARAIAAAVPDPFTVLDYACDPDETLDPRQADRNWLSLQLDSTRDHLGHEVTKHRRTKEALTTIQAELARTQQALNELQAAPSASMFRRVARFVRHIPAPHLNLGGAARKPVDTP